MKEIEMGTGKFNIHDSRDAHLQRIFALVKNSRDQTTVVENHQDNEYIAFTKLRGPDWYFVTVYPKALLAETAFDTAQFVLLAGFMALLIEVVLLFFILQQKITRPLKRLLIATKQVSEGEFNVQLDRDRTDELGRLATSFLQMAEQLQESFATLESRVTERTAALTQAKRTADAANQAKSEFLANMSHELRTPLNGILGYAQILARSSALPDQERHGVSIIHQCGVHLLHLINDVLDLAKIEARHLDLSPQALHLPGLLQGVVEICQIRAEQKGLDFRYELAATLSIGVEVDEKRLCQVLINLLDNAIKFTDQGSVSLRVELLSLEPDSTRLCFWVSDTGIGIAPEHFDQLFQAFEQVGEQRRQAEGTGLGLAISQQLVQLMGGHIQVKSQVGRGSEFWFAIELPLVLDWHQPQPLLAHHIVSYAGAPRQILVVDDRWENRAVLANLLAPLGFVITEAENGQAGLKQMRQQLPDLVITDLAMPIMDGIAMLQQLRRDPALKALKVIVSSASVSPTDQQISWEAGGDAFLGKPVQAEALWQLLAQQLQLTWIYAALPPTPLAEPALTALMIPPQEDLQLLLELTQKGRLQQLTALAVQMGQQDTRYHVFTQQVLRLAQQFQSEKIEQLIQPYLASSHPIQE
jgi:signal transduction histidine kinase/CheY-like chemotaxis protein